MTYAAYHVDDYHTDGQLIAIGADKVPLLLSDTATLDKPSDVCPCGAKALAIFNSPCP